LKLSFIERLWRSLKWELIYLKEFREGKELRQEVKTWFDWYNRQRLHQGLNYQTPDEIFYGGGGLCDTEK
jgi:putative transposase